jgi:NAD+ diphosphatase
MIHTFISRLIPPEGPREAARWFIFQGDRLLAQVSGDTANVPVLCALDELCPAAERVVYLGYLEDGNGAQVDCFAAEIDPDAPLPDGFLADGLRGLYGRLDDDAFAVAGRAVQVLAWDRTHHYCGQCGTLTENQPHERAKRCPACGLVSYPRLSPAIIIAVTRDTPEGKRLLLARNHRFPAGRYSVVAGYVEPGETLEECAQREVCEEVGIDIRAIRYFGSQPWPFPNSLMIGFTAEYADGEITLEDSEIAEAGWFAPDALPNLPPKMSIARRLIDTFVAENLPTGAN